MDPYLEGYLWTDVHQRLATEISRRLAPRLKPRYVVRLAIYVVEDSTPEAEIGIMYPDVEVLESGRGGVPRRQRVIREAMPAPMAAQTTPAPLIIPLLRPVEVRLVSVEIRDVARNELVTCIEILSPVNKREPGLSEYRQKRQRLHQASVHILEIDLLRRGTRPLTHPRVPDVPYLITLTRAEAQVVAVWPIRLQDALPTVPVPLRAPDPDVPLELAPVLAAIYDEAAYELSIDYSQPPPPPPLSAEDGAWLKTRLSLES